MSLSETDVRDRIVHLLSIYPVISPSMLQSGLGPQISAKVWRPILSTMIENSEISRDSIVAESPSGRHNNYTLLSLKELPEGNI